MKFLPVLSLTLAVVHSELTSITTGSFKYIKGDVNLLISAPHGGRNSISGSPLRKNGCLGSDGNCFYSQTDCLSPDAVNCEVNIKADFNTDMMADMIHAQVEETIGAKPHLLVMRKHRKYIDANRDIEEACMGDANCEEVYHDYHDQYAAIIESFSPRGLLIDFHGQAHGKNSTEFGYRIDKDVIDAARANNDNLDTSCTLDALLAEGAHGCTQGQLIMNTCSMGDLLEAEGFKGLPSSTNPAAGQTNYQYFRGGFTVLTYHSDTVDAIQAEAPGEVRIGTTAAAAAMREAYSEGLGNAIGHFWNSHYVCLDRQGLSHPC